MVFGGLASHKFLQQVVAANLSGVHLDFSSFGNDEACSSLLDTPCTIKPTAKQVALHVLQVSRDPGTFIKDAALLLFTKGTGTNNETCIIS